MKKHRAASARSSKTMNPPYGYDHAEDSLMYDIRAAAVITQE
ncbi:MAG: hypothetical protein PUK25_05760 [Clostridiales bacterium]|nr:hypothetical protein [Clostridiales bacterium]MDY5702038.1 hypothetical protein [Eubacteriales bacterium]